MTTILNPEKTIRLGDTDVTFRDLAWPQMKKFLAKLSTHIQGLVGSAVQTAKAGQSAEAVGASILDQIPAVIASTSELAEYLIRECAITGPQDPESLSSTEFLAALDASLEVTFNDEFVKLGKSAAGRVQAAFNLGASLPTPPIAPSARPSTSLSGKDGPMRTRVDSPLPNSASSAT